MDKKKSRALARNLSRVTFAGVRIVTGASNRLGLPVISTGRPFAFYRHVFFGGKSETDVLAELAGQRIVDVGCGLTPYTPDSMFQACLRNDVEFYGVDPKLGEGLKLGAFDRLKVGLTRGSGLDPNAPGEARRLGCYADAMPFEDASVDLILSSWALGVWIRDPDVIERIFVEFRRVLKPGAQVRVYPTMHADDARNPGDLADVLRAFEVKQWFCAGFDPLNLPPAYVTQHTLRP